MPTELKPIQTDSTQQHSNSGHTVVEPKIITPSKELKNAKPLVEISDFLNITSALKNIKAHNLNKDGVKFDRETQNKILEIFKNPSSISQGKLNFECQGNSCSGLLKSGNENHVPWLPKDGSSSFKAAEAKTQPETPKAEAQTSKPSQDSTPKGSEQAAKTAGDTPSNSLAQNASNQLANLANLPPKELVQILNNPQVLAQALSPQEQKAAMALLDKLGIKTDPKNPPQTLGELKALIVAQLKQQGVPENQLEQKAAEILKQFLMKPQGEAEQAAKKTLEPQAFLENALKSGKFGLQEASAQAKDIVGVKVLGTLTHEQGEFLMANLKLMVGGNPEEVKFAMLKLGEAMQLGSKEMMALLNAKNLQDPAVQKLLQNLQNNLGEINFLKLIEQAKQNASKQELAYDPKKISPDANTGLERWLVAARGKEEGELAWVDPWDEEGKQRLKDENRSVFANVYELLGLRRQYEGKQRLYTWIGYSSIAAMVTMALLWVVMH